MGPFCILIGIACRSSSSSAVTSVTAQFGRDFTGEPYTAAPRMGHVGRTAAYNFCVLPEVRDR